MIRKQDEASNIHIECTTLNPSRSYMALEILKTVMETITVGMSREAQVVLAVKMADMLIEELEK